MPAPHPLSRSEAELAYDALPDHVRDDLRAREAAELRRVRALTPLDHLDELIASARAMVAANWRAVIASAKDRWQAVRDYRSAAQSGDLRAFERAEACLDDANYDLARQLRYWRASRQLLAKFEAARAEIALVTLAAE